MLLKIKNDRTIDFQKKVNLYDNVLIMLHGNISQGIVTLISTRGVNVDHLEGPIGTKFYKWSHVRYVLKDQSTINSISDFPLDPL